MTHATHPLLTRRRNALGTVGALTALTLSACGGGGSSSSSTSSNAALSGLSVSEEGLSPAFDAATTSYDLAVANTVASLKLVPTTAGADASVQVNGTTVASGSSTATVALAEGANTLSVVVTAADGSTARTYTVRVTRAPASASPDASLRALTLSSGELSPTFAAGTTAYTVAVANAVSMVTLTPTATSSAASIRINGVAVTSGSASAAISLAVGTTTLTVRVTAQDKVTTRSYTIVVTRAATTVSSDASLKALVLSAGALTPAFASATSSYTATVANSVTSVTVTPTATSAAATVSVNGVAVGNGSNSGAIALAVGSNTIKIVVTAQDSGTSSTTTVVVTRAAASVSTDASLSALVLSSGSLSPSFAAATTSYTAAISNTVASLTLTPTTASSGAKVTVNGSTVASGAASSAITLAVGSNTLSIVVTAADGVTARTYTVVATRAATGTCTLTATETQGPYPLLAILSNSAMVRSNITEGKTGVPLTVTLTVQDVSNGCAPVAGAAVYIWHCDKDGLYSGYSTGTNAGQAGLTYLRGIQVTNSSGQVTFTTIYPGWYAGRITHIHAQVYLNDNLSVTATATTQLAFPQDVTTAVYNSTLYSAKGQNNSVASFAADNVFSDGTSTEMVAISGSVASGYAANLTVNIA
ncbi:cadherin-like beta sandwich domain-containing protein [Acidovorax sp. Root267]|uniref:cadherin-like beta sandwich domain-containing protein n=1 Tax=Acidovorax sp. Root267 TaxID=1736505 RepID=UPI0009EAD9B6|nr:cadherin-like beta sandwich domain-containing protein [Acidovorax sp. Root267]